MTAKTATGRVGERPADRPAESGGEPRQNFIMKLVNSSPSWIGLLVKLFFLAGAAVSCYFVGLFLNLGLDLMVVIDKQSLLEAIFFYAAIFSVIMAISTIAIAPFTALTTGSNATKIADVEPPPAILEPEPVASPEPAGWSDWLKRLVPFAGTVQTAKKEAVIVFDRSREAAEQAVTKWKNEAVKVLHRTLPVVVTAAFLFTFWMLHAWRAALFIGAAVICVLIARRWPKHAYPLAVICFVGMGYLRGDLQSQATLGMLIHGAHGQKPIEATIVLSSTRGLVALTAGDEHSVARRARFMPWEQVAFIEVNPKLAATSWSQRLCALTSRPAWLPALPIPMHDPCDRA